MAVAFQQMALNKILDASAHDIAGIGFLAVFVIVGEEGVYPSG